MNKTIRRIIKEMGYLDSCGYHPGTGILIAFLLMGGIAGAKNNNPWSFVTGAGIMGLLISPMYLIGCYERGKIEDEVTIKKLAQESCKNDQEPLY